MSIIKKRGNGDFFPTMRNNLSEFFDIDNFFEPNLLSGLTNKFSRVPATNIYETDEEFVVELAAPGMKKKDFEVDVDNGLLEIKVEKEEESKEENKGYTRREYNFNSFYRSFSLPETVQSEDIEAKYENGILKISLPKTKAAKKQPKKLVSVA